MEEPPLPSPLQLPGTGNGRESGEPFFWIFAYGDTLPTPWAPAGLQLPKVVKAELSVDRNGLSVNPSALFIKDMSEAPETIVQCVSMKSRGV